MQTYRLTVNERVFLLASAAEGQNAREAVVAALHGGGGFADIQLIDGRTMSILVSPGLAVTLEEFTVVDDEPTVDQRAQSTIYDWDYFPELES